MHTVLLEKRPQTRRRCTAQNAQTSARQWLSIAEPRLSGRLVSNAVMASAPQHPFWLEVLQEIFQHLVIQTIQTILTIQILAILK